MRIKINDKLKKILAILKKDGKEAEVINFENRTRKGATIIEDEPVEKKKERKGARKAFIGMLMLLILTITLNIRFRDYLKFEKVEIISPDNAISVSSSVDTNEETKVVKVEEKEKLVFIPALEGEVQKMYSIDKVIYSKTLQQWKTHDGIDISPSGSNVVKAIEKGVVDSVYNDSFYGMTVKIEHIDGYISVYSNLDKNVYVNVGESVSKGQKIGKVGSTAIGEASDEPHLHFMLYLNNNVVNPTYIFK